MSCRPALGTASHGQSLTTIPSGSRFIGSQGEVKKKPCLPKIIMDVFDLKDGPYLKVIRFYALDKLNSWES